MKKRWQRCCSRQQENNDEIKEQDDQIDAKSIMGIFSLDLSKPIDLAIHAESNMDEIMEVLKPYLV